jgi:hypothetical protein
MGGSGYDVLYAGPGPTADWSDNDWISGGDGRDRLSYNTPRDSVPGWVRNETSSVEVSV